MKNSNCFDIYYTVQLLKELEYLFIFVAVLENMNHCKKSIAILDAWNSV